jgi:hypothetical protein
MFWRELLYLDDCQALRWKLNGEFLALDWHLFGRWERGGSL